MSRPSLSRTLMYYWFRYVLRKSHLTAACGNPPVRMKFPIEDGGGRRMYKRGDYEPHLSEFVRQNINLKPGDCVLDIGANIGWYSMFLSKVAPAGVTIYAFEPDPDNYQVLTENIALNGASNVIPIQAALAERSGTMKLHLYPKKNTGRHSLLPINEGQTVEVRTATVDEFLAENQIDSERVKFVKIDVEGYEFNVLRGASALLQSQPRILCEFAPEYMKKGGLEPGQLLSLLSTAGYSITELTETGADIVSITELVNYKHNTDLLMQPAA